MQPYQYALEAVEAGEILAQHEIALDTLETLLDLSRIESERFLIPLFRQIALELQALKDREDWLYFKRILHEAIVLAKAQETRLYLVDGCPSRQKRLEPRARIIEILGKILPSIANTIRIHSIRTQLRGTSFHPELEALGIWLNRSGLAIATPFVAHPSRDRWLEGRMLGRILTPDLLEDLIDDSERLESLFARNLTIQDDETVDRAPKVQSIEQPAERTAPAGNETATIASLKPKPERKRRSASPPPRPQDPTELIPNSPTIVQAAKKGRDDPFEQFFLKLIPHAGSAGCRWVQKRLWIPHPSTAQQLGLDPQSMVEQLASLGVIEADQNNPYIKVRPYREQRGIYIRAEYSERIRNLRTGGS